MSKVVVVGAGVGGLAVAARLAASGHQVCVYERAEQVGGKLGRHIRHTPHGTFRFDTGPSLLALPQVFTELFAATGGPAAELDLVELDPIVRHVFADGSTLDSCADPTRFAERIRAAFGEPAAQDWQRLWQRAERVWHASWRDILRKRVDSPLALAKLAWRPTSAGWADSDKLHRLTSADRADSDKLHRLTSADRADSDRLHRLCDLAAIAPGRTLHGLGRSYLRDPRLRMLLDRYATYTGADPRRAPAALVAIPYAEMAFGGWYLRGGLATLADALLRRCLDLGVTVRTGATVTAIDAAGGRVHGVRVDRTPVPADIVVSNVDAQILYRDLLPNPRRLTTLDDRSLAGFVLLLGVRGRTPGLAHHTVFFPGTRIGRSEQDVYSAEFDAVFGDPGRGIPARLAPEPTVFVTVADDPSVRPDGYETWFVLVNAARHGRTLSSVDWMRPGLAEAYADRVLAVLAGRGLDVRDRLVFREIRTPADLGRSAAAPGGAIYGTAGHGLLRPANRGPVRGLFLVGGSAHPGGGLPLAALSAEIVAASI